MKPWFLQPFRYIAGIQALLVGTGIMSFTGIVAYYSHTHFDGVLDTHIGFRGTTEDYIAEPVIALCSTVLVFFISGRVFSTSKPRLVDIAGTMALSRVALLPAAIIAFLQPGNISITHLPPAALLVGLAVLLCTIWFVVLMYQAFTVSANVKGPNAALVFTGTIILAEILSKIAFHYLTLLF